MRRRLVGRRDGKARGTITTREGPYGVVTKREAVRVVRVPRVALVPLMSRVVRVALESKMSTETPVGVPV